jgi:hypothetical protein
MISRFISNERFSKYASMDEYKANILLSKNFYVPLSVMEVSLRNAVNAHFVIFYGKQWLVNEASFLQRDALAKIDEAKNKLRSRNETITHAKLTAELPFGFWTSLFQKPYDKIMRIPTLRGIFANLPSKETMFVDRRIISSRLNHIRKFRNRIFHFEKIIYKDEFENIALEIKEMLEFLHPDISGLVVELENAVSTQASR